MPTPVKFPLPDPSSIASDAPILFFDSGVGGLSVLRAAQLALPQAPIVYAADFAGLPYGNKTEIQITARVAGLLGRLVERFQPRLVTIACNTACTIALNEVRAALDIPIVGTVPAIKPASEQTQSGVIGLLGTAATIRQPYVDELQRQFASDMTLLRYAAPELVQAAEAKLRGETVPDSIFAGAISALRDQPGGQDMDTVVLGCTHFPLVQEELADATGPTMRFVDGAAGIARRIGVVTQGQQWPEELPEAIFVSTGTLADAEPYKPALAAYGLTRIEAMR